jgi:hypothetical protein
MYKGFSATAEPSISGQVATMSGAETSADTPLYDLLDNVRTRLLSIDTSGETTAADIQIETTATMSCNFVIIDNHNLKTADAFYRLEQGDAPIETMSVAYSGTLGSALSADTIDGNDEEITVVADGVSLAKFTAATDPRWEIIIDDVSTFDADVTLGEIVLGTSFTPARSPELNQSFKYMYKTAGFSESGGGKKYGFAANTTSQRQWTLRWKVISDSDLSSFLTLYDVTCGPKFPFYIDFGLDATPRLYRVRFIENSLSFTQLTKDAWSLSVTVEEEI